MGKLGQMWVRLGLKKDEFKSGIESAGNDVTTFGGKVSKMSTAAKAAWALVGAAVIKFGKDCISAFSEQEKATAKLNSTLKATGGAVGLNAKELQDYASELQNVTTFGDEVTLNAMALLTTFKSVSGEVFKDSIASAQDMATVLGTDLNSAILQLGKALESPEIGLTALRRTGVTFTTEQIENIKKLIAEGKKYEAQVLILEEIHKKFGGAAKEAAETATGSWIQAKNAVGDLMETLGSAITATKKFSVTIRDWATEVNNLLNSPDVSGWTKFLTIIGYTSKGYYQVAEANAHNNEQMAQGKALAQDFIAKSKNLLDIEREIANAKRLNADKKDTSWEKVYENELSAYLVKKRTQNEIDKQTEAERAAAEATAAAEEAKKYDSLIGKHKKKIELLEVEKNTSWSKERIAEINDEIEAEQRLIDALNNVSAARMANMSIPLSVPNMPEAAKAQVSSTNTSDKIFSTEQYNKYYQSLLEKGQSFIERYKEQQEQIAETTQAFGSAMSQGLGNGLSYLSNCLSGIESFDAGTMVQSLLTPLADAAVRAGMIIMTSGTAIEALRTSLTSFIGVGAIAAGAILIAIGAAAKVGLSAIGGSGKSSAGLSTGYTGGYSSSSSASSASSKLNINVNGVLKGNDIVLCYDKTKAKNER